MGLVWFVVVGFLAVGAQEITDIEEEDLVPDDVVLTAERPPDPCDKMKCGRGEWCVLVEGRATCACNTECDIPEDPRYKACSNMNETFPSKCHLDLLFCSCSKRDKSTCGGRKQKELRFDYFGQCRDFSPCTDYEMEMFPRRMRDWLLIVMKEMANRKQLEREYSSMVKTAETDPQHTDAVIWKFCDFDKRPTNRQIDRRELTYTIQTIKPLERCLVPFLKGCDRNKNTKIDLNEWGECLGLEKEKIEDKCKAIFG